MAFRLPYPYPDPITGQWDPFQMIRNLRVLTQQTLNTTTAVTAGQGGTGIQSYAAGDLIYASGVDTLTKRAIGNTGEVLTVAAAVPTWSHSISLGTITSSRIVSGNTVTASRVINAQTATIVHTLSAVTGTLKKLQSSVNLELRATSKINFTNITTAPGASLGTLGNAPTVGDPARWMRVLVNGVTGYIPVWGP